MWPSDAHSVTHDLGILHPTMTSMNGYFIPKGLILLLGVIWGALRKYCRRNYPRERAWLVGLDR